MDIPYLLGNKNHVSSAFVSKAVVNTRSSISIWSLLNKRLKYMRVHIHIEKGEIIVVWDKWGRPFGGRELVLGPEA